MALIVDKLVELLTEARGLLSVYGMVFTVDRGFGKMSLFQHLTSKRTGDLIVIPKHILRTDTFVGFSLLELGCDEDVVSYPDEYRETVDNAIGDKARQGQM